MYPLAKAAEDLAEDPARRFTDGLGWYASEAESTAPAERITTSETTATTPGPKPLDLISFDELEAMRVQLAGAGEHHGYETLAKACGVSRSTVVRRYRGRRAPGVAPY